MSGAGQLREELRFESPTPVEDGAGNYTEGWTSEFTRSARVKPLRGGEDVMAARLTGTQPVVITVRKCEETIRIDTDWRAVDTRSGAIYQVKSPPADMLENRLYLDMLAAAGVAA